MCPGFMFLCFIEKEGQGGSSRKCSQGGNREVCTLNSASIFNLLEGEIRAIRGFRAEEQWISWL